MLVEHNSQGKVLKLIISNHSQGWHIASSLQLQLEEDAAKTPVEPPKVKTPPLEQKPKSLIQTIYEENRVMQTSSNPKNYSQSKLSYL